MKFEIKYILSVGLLLLTQLGFLPTRAQASYSPNQWQYILTPHYEIYFLPPMRTEAQRIANSLEKLYIPVQKSLQTTTSRCMIVLDNRSTKSNGNTLGCYVNFYTFPSQRTLLSYRNDWLNFLAVHELRHAAQHNLQVEAYGLLKPHWVKLPFFTPSWLFEGDAVGIETALTKGGRGRIPSFLLEYKVNLLEYGGFSYYKNLQGSLKHNIPNHYILGYVLTTYLRKHYGPGIIRELFGRKSWADAINLMYTEQKVKKLTGKTIVEIHQDANNELKQLWEAQLKGLTMTPFTKINQRQGDDFINYSQPTSVTNGHLVIKSGLGFYPQFVHIDPKGEEKQMLQASFDDEKTPFSLAQNKIYWLEQSITKKNALNAIKSYNLANNSYHTIVSKTRYNAITAHPTENKLAAIESDTTYHHNMVILDATDGQVLQTLPNPSNHYYFHPSWSLDGKYLLAIRQDNNAVYLFDTKEGTEKELFSFDQAVIAHPLLAYPYVYYESSYSGIDNIYAFDINSKKHFQVTSSKYGAYKPNISSDGKFLLYNDFTKNGMDAVKIHINPHDWIALEKIEDRNINYHAPLVTQENNETVFKNTPRAIYPIKNYNPWKKLTLTVDNGGLILKDFFHTFEWDIIHLRYTDLDINYVNPTIRPVISTYFVYKGWYPIISFESSLLNLLHKKQLIQNTNQLCINLPINWKGAEYTYTLSLETKSLFFSKSIRDNEWVYRQRYKVTTQRLLPKSQRDIINLWGQAFSLSYLHTVYGELPVQQLSPKVKFLFPGIFNNHSFRIYHQWDYITATIANKTPDPKQKASFKKSEATGKELLIQYALPIYYPDLAIGKLIYFQTINLNLLYKLNYAGSEILLQSGRADVIFTMKWVNPAIGIGYSSEGKPIWHLGLNYSY